MMQAQSGSRRLAWTMHCVARTTEESTAILDAQAVSNSAIAIRPSDKVTSCPDEINMAT